jgi:hypothetical protein
MNKPGLAFVGTSRHKLPNYGPGLALQSRSARLLLLPRPRQPAQACSYHRGLLYGGCNAVIKSGINLIKTHTVANSHKDHMVGHIHLNKSI